MRLKFLARLMLVALLITGAGWAQDPAALRIGQKVPDFELINQDNQPVHLKQFAGKVVLVTFLYTRCPFPNKCPMLKEKLGKTRALLDKLQAQDKFQVLSITIDPKNDTPERLKQYAQGNLGVASNWSFLTGKASDVARVAALFGMVYYEEKGIVEHNLRTALIDPQGRLHTVLSGNDWKEGALASSIKQLLVR